MIADYPLIPDEAFLYFPQEDKMIENRNGAVQRIIFGGGVPLRDEQIRRIKILRQTIERAEKKENLLGFPDDFLLRFLQATGFDYENCIQALGKYYEWQKKMLPLQITQKIFGNLRQGIVYLCGRDYHFRPIIVVDIKKILDLEIKEKQLLGTLGFFFQYVIENCLIEGQVQAWNTIIDLGNCSVFSLGSTLVDIVKHLSQIFRVRLNHNYLLRCPSSMKFLWGMVKNVLNQDQLRKITMSDKKVLKEQDFVKINRNQVEVKYGGTRPNLTSFWPIEIDPYAFKVSNLQVNLITPREYDKFYNEGRLKDRKIKKSFVDKFKRLMSRQSFREEDIMTEQQGLPQGQEEEQVLYPAQIRPQIPQMLANVFTFHNLFQQ